MIGDDDDLGDVLSEESQGLLQAGGLPSHKRLHDSESTVLP